MLCLRATSSDIKSRKGDFFLKILNIFPFNQNNCSKANIEQNIKCLNLNFSSVPFYIYIPTCRIAGYLCQKKLNTHGIFYKDLKIQNHNLLKLGANCRLLAMLLSCLRDLLKGKPRETVRTNFVR